MTIITDSLRTKQLAGGFTDLREQGQRSRTPELKQGGFIGFRQGVMMCQPGAGPVPRYDQRHLGELAMSGRWVSRAARNVELSFGCHSFLQSF